MSVQADFLHAALPALDLVYNLARRFTEGPHEVEDLVQETYLRAYRAWSEGTRPRKMEPWIATICLNTGRSWRRRSRPEISVEDLDAVDRLDREVAAPSLGEEVAEAAIDALDREAVHAALRRLPEHQRIAITLMDLHGFTATEVSRVTGSPRGTVLARVHRGRKRLALLLEGSMNLDEET